MTRNLDGYKPLYWIDSDGQRHYFGGAEEVSYIYIVMNEMTDMYGNVTSEVCSAWSTLGLATQELADIADEHSAEFEGGAGDSIVLPPTEEAEYTDEYYVLTLGVDEN